MINIEKAKKFYKEYISNYNPEDPKIALKIAHIYRTAEKAKKIAVNLGLSEEDIKLAELIGLLHDIGRFEQIKQYHTFADSKSINHGEYGVKVLFEDGVIKEFIENRQYDDIIYKAIINHNKNKIEDGLNERELLHSKIIRDADKWDILYIQTFESVETILDYDSNYFYGEITPVIYEQCMNQQHIDYSKRKCVEDRLISPIAFVFDIYFDYTLEQIKKDNYLRKMIDRFEYNNKLKEQIETIYDQIVEYINNRLIKE